jgi:NTE family protein
VITTRPDILVCGGGGTLGEAWMRGVLSGLEAAAGIDLRECEYFVGTSAGSIVTAALAAGRRPEAGDRAARAWAQQAEDEPQGGAVAGLLRGAGRVGAALVTPLAPVTLAGVAPAGAAVRAVTLAAGPRPERRLDRLGRYIDGLGASFDGRLRVVAVDRRNGRRAVFGAPKAPRASVTDAVLASCAVPWLFAPVEIGGREYVDGGVWSPTNLDAAPATRGSRLLCLAPTAVASLQSLPLSTVRRFTSSALTAETLAVRARGSNVHSVVPDAASAEAMGEDLMDARRIEPVLDAAFAQGRALAG